MLYSHILELQFVSSFTICSCVWSGDKKRKLGTLVRSRMPICTIKPKERGWILHPAVCHLHHTAPVPCVVGKLRTEPSKYWEVSNLSAFIKVLRNTGHRYIAKINTKASCPLVSAPLQCGEALSNQRQDLFPTWIWLGLVTALTNRILAKVPQAEVLVPWALASYCSWKSENFQCASLQ